MTKPNPNPPLPPSLDQLIDALMEGNIKEVKPVDLLDEETARLFSISQKIVAQNQRYPGIHQPLPQHRLALLTAYRTEMKKESQANPQKTSFFAQRKLSGWAFALAALVIVAVLILSDPGQPVLSGAAGTQTSWLVPLLLLAAVAVAALIWYFISRRK